MIQHQNDVRMQSYVPTNIARNGVIHTQRPIPSHCLKVSWHWSCRKRKIGRHDVLYPAARDQTHGYTRLGPSGTKCARAAPMRLNPLSPAASFGPWNMRYCSIFINIDTPLEKKNTLQVPFAHYNEYHKNLIILTPQQLS